MKKILAFILCALMLTETLAPTFIFAAFDDSKLTWDGKSVTLSALAEKLGYDMVDSNGNYKPMYYDSAKELWNKGLLHGSDGTFDLDKPLTRTEGVIMILRLLGMEQEAKDAMLTSSFADVPDWAKYQVAYATKKGITGGYSATVFGANDAMTASQYLTLVLRVMGYKDSEDFAWDKAYDKAFEIGLIGAPCREQYMRSNLFLRDNVAVISYNALFQAPCKDGGVLSVSIAGEKPEGIVPYATAADKPRIEEKPEAQPTDTVVYYELFAVPQYENVAPNAVRDGYTEDNRAMYFYKRSTKISEYQELLAECGFSRSAWIRDTLLKYDMICYRKGNLHVTIGLPPNSTSTHVRIVEKEISVIPTPDELRELSRLFNH